MTIDIDEAKVERNEFGLWLGWTLATAGGMLIGFLPALLLVNVLSLGLAQIVVPALAGTLVGLAQWMALRRFLDRPLGLDPGKRNFLGGWIYSWIIPDPKYAQYSPGWHRWIFAVWRNCGNCAVAFITTRDPSSAGVDHCQRHRLDGRLLGQPGCFAIVL